MPNLPSFRHPAAIAVSVLAVLGALAPASAPAAILTVGAGGAYATIQGALTQAQSTAAADEIRIRAGSFAEHLSVGLLNAGNHLDISGGWAAGFTVRDNTPGATIVDAGGTGRALFFTGVSSATVALRGLAFHLGIGSPFGGGVSLTQSGTSVVRFERCVFEDNTIISNDSVSGAAGAGLSVSAGSSSQFQLVDSMFTENTAVMNSPSNGSARGGGVVLTLSGSATAVVRGAQFLANTVSGGAVNTGAGLHATTSGNAVLRIEDTFFFGNHGNDETDGSALTLIATESSTIDARRLFMSENGTNDDGSNQAGLWTFDSGSLRLSDSLLVHSDQGIFASAHAATGALRLMNLTVTEQTGVGIELEAPSGGVASISNSISFANPGGNTSLTGAGLVLESNLFGVDPLFVDPTADDFALSPGSPALHAGIATPLGGLSTYDLAHAPRAAGPLPDRGALERNAIFGDGLESGDLRWWVAEP